MAKAKKKAAVGPVRTGTVGKAKVTRTKVAIYDGSADSRKMKYVAKYTVYNVDPEKVAEAVRRCVDDLESEWQRANAPVEKAS